MNSFINKYKPNTIDDIYLPEALWMKINTLITNKIIPNMILSGHSGTGKTATIITMAKQIYGDLYNDAVIEFNASDNRGLEIINNTIIYFCKKKISNNDKINKLIIMDEADVITKKAQNAINNLMEEFNNTTKFIFTCNDSNKIIESIQSRCLLIYYPPIKNDFIIKKLKYICKNEKIDYTSEALSYLVLNCNGDMRIAINNLEVLYYGFDKITKDIVISNCNQPKPEIIVQLIKECANRNTNEAINIINNLKIQGYCGCDILLTLINIIKNITIDENIKLKYIRYISDTYIKTSDGLDSNLQLYGCISRLILIKD
jgi:replication factor C subunit 2/4